MGVTSYWRARLMCKAVGGRPWAMVGPIRPPKVPTYRPRRSYHPDMVRASDRGGQKNQLTELNTSCVPGFLPPAVLLEDTTLGSWCFWCLDTRWWSQKKGRKFSKLWIKSCADLLSTRRRWHGGIDLGAMESSSPGTTHESCML
jgi:hypothetical protein